MSWIQDEKHVVAIASTSRPGEWRTYCPGCETDRGEPVERCAVYPEQWPTVPVLVEDARLFVPLSGEPG